MNKIHEFASTDKLSNWDLESLDFDEIWYSYTHGYYEGSGDMIVRKGDLFTHHDMGHCSCYGPTDRFSGNFLPWNDLIKMLKRNPDYFSRDIEPLLKAYNLNY